MTPTLDQWHKHTSYRKDLEALISNPVFQTALEIIKDVGNRPVVPAALPPGATLTEWFAMMGAKRDGYFSAITNLIALTRTKPEAAEEPKPWETPRKDQ